MTRCRHLLPGFRASCLAVAGLYAVIAGGLLLRGPVAGMADFAIPAAALASPHYQDAIVWVYTHQLIVGLLIGAFGLTVTDPAHRRGVARLLLAAHVVYVYLDVRSSDSPLGNGLYQGPASLLPVVIGTVGLLLFAHLSVCRPERARPAPADS